MPTFRNRTRVPIRIKTGQYVPAGETVDLTDDEAAQVKASPLLEPVAAPARPKPTTSSEEGDD